MPTYQSILQSLQAFFPGHKSYLKVLSGLLLAVLNTRDVNLVKLAAYQGSEAQEASQYRKLQRFFQPELCSRDFVGCTEFTYSSHNLLYPSPLFYR